MSGFRHRSDPIDLRAKRSPGGRNRSPDQAHTHDQGDGGGDRRWCTGRLIVETRTPSSATNAEPAGPRRASHMGRASCDRTWAAVADSPGSARANVPIIRRMQPLARSGAEEANSLGFLISMHATGNWTRVRMQGPVDGTHARTVNEDRPILRDRDLGTPGNRLLVPVL